MRVDAWSILPRTAISPTHHSDEFGQPAIIDKNRSTTITLARVDPPLRAPGTQHAIGHRAPAIIAITRRIRHNRHRHFAQIIRGRATITRRPPTAHNWPRAFIAHRCNRTASIIDIVWCIQRTITRPSQSNGGDRTIGRIQISEWQITTTIGRKCHWCI